MNAIDCLPSAVSLYALDKGEKRSIASSPPPAAEVGQIVRTGDTFGKIGTANPIAINPGVEGSLKEIFPDEVELVKLGQVLIVIKAVQRDRYHDEPGILRPCSSRYRRRRQSRPRDREELGENRSCGGNS